MASPNLVLAPRHAEGLQPEVVSLATVFAVVDAAEFALAGAQLAGVEALEEQQAVCA